MGLNLNIHKYKVIFFLDNENSLITIIKYSNNSPLSLVFEIKDLRFIIQKHPISIIQISCRLYYF